MEVKNYIVNYLSDANRDIMLIVEGMCTETYRYDPWSQRVSVELDYAAETTRGEAGENIGSDIATGDVEKVWYRRSHLSSTLYAVDASGDVAFHLQYDEWGKPETDTLARQNHAGIDNLNNFTGYTYDEVLGIYFAQNRFYDAEMHRFTQEDPIRSGMNWFSYVGNNPLTNVDLLGLKTTIGGTEISTTVIEGAEYASLRDLIAIYDGKLSSKPEYSPDNKHTYYTGNMGSIYVSFYTKQNGINERRLSLLAPLNNWASRNIQDRMFKMIEGTNYISVEYFHKMMCELGYQKELKLGSGAIKTPEPAPSSSDKLVSAEQLAALGWPRTNTAEVAKWNSILEAYKITDKASIAMFFATMMAETKGTKTIEMLKKDGTTVGGYPPEERGAGYIQLTHRDQHLAFLKSVGSSFTGADTADFISKNYPMEAAAYFWANVINTGENNLNAYAEKHGMSIGVFLVTQFFVNSNPTKEMDPTLVQIRNGTLQYNKDYFMDKYVNENGSEYYRLRLADGTVFATHLQGWDEREKAYNAAYNAFY